MPIQNPIIDAGPTLSRTEVKTVVGNISNIIPPDDYVKVVDGLLTIVNQTPLREGQFVFVQAAGELSVSMYIVVLVGGWLAWKRVYSAGVITDPRTGLPKDPNLGFYSTLAY